MDGINKQENDCEQKKYIFFMPIMVTLSGKFDSRYNADIWLIEPSTLLISNH